MSELVCVTNRKICTGDFLKRIEKIVVSRPGGIILREKDLSEQEYIRLAKQVLTICNLYKIPCTLHTYISAAIYLGADRIHLPMHILRIMTAEEKSCFSSIGVSCHSVEEAEEAERCGCTYIIAGHVFDTDCKRGSPGHGLAFLHEICESVSVPVYGIGGINPSNYHTVRSAGAAGACVMSGCMQCADITNFMERFAENEI